MNKFRQITLHLVVWVSLMLMFMLIASNGRPIEHGDVVIFVYFGIVNISLFYANYLLILPTFLNPKKYTWCAFAMLLLVLVSIFIKCGLAYYFYEIVLVRNDGKNILGFWEYFASAGFVSCLFIFLSTILKFITDWFLNEKIKTNLENEKLISELAFLKS